jgi:hypothetical protein
VWYNVVMADLYLILLILGAICFALAASGRPALTVGRGIGLLPLGLFFWILVPLIQYARVVW